MGFAVAFVNVQILYQKFIKFPWLYDRHTDTLIVHPHRKLPFKQRLLKMPIWHLNTLLMILAWLYCLVKFFVILKRAQTNQSTTLLMETCLCVIGLAQCTFALAIIYTIDHNPTYFLYSSREILKDGSVTFVGFPTTERPPDLLELIGYGIGLGPISYPIATSLLPFLFPRVDPMSSLLPTSIPYIVRKLISSVTYALVSGYCAIACTAFVLFILASCQIFEMATHKNLVECKGEEILRKPNMLEKLAVELTIKELKFLEWIYPKWKEINRQSKNKMVLVKTKSNVSIVSGSGNLNVGLSKFLLRHNSLRIMMTPCNYNVSVLIPAMAGVGVVSAVMLNFGIVVLRSRNDLRVFFCVGIYLSVNIQWLIQFFCLHACLPSVYSEKTIQHMKKVIRKKVEHRIIRGMKPYGFSMGGFFTMKRATALDMLESISDYTMSLLMSE